MMALGKRISGGDEYYTPRWIFDGLGLHFDLDPSSPLSGGGHVPATSKYTIEDDGLARPWQGLVWMNPPYSKPTPWVDKFIMHNNGIALLPFTRGKWWFNLWNHSDAIMPIGYDFKFNHLDGTKKVITFNTALFAIGEVSVAALHKLKLHRIR